MRTKDTASFDQCFDPVFRALAQSALVHLFVKTNCSSALYVYLISAFTSVLVPLENVSFPPDPKSLNQMNCDSIDDFPSPIIGAE